jgi:hypothetical protein
MRQKHLLISIIFVGLILISGCIQSEPQLEIPADELESVPEEPLIEKENQVPIIDESKFLDKIPLSVSKPTTLDLSDKATDPDGDKLIWSTDVVSKEGLPYNHKIKIEIENNIATITPISEGLSEGRIYFTVSDFKSEVTVDRPYTFLQEFIPIEIIKPVQGKVYDEKSIELEVVEIPGEIIEYWVNPEWMSDPSTIYTGPTILTENDGIIEGENKLMFKTKSSPMTSAVSFTVDIQTEEEENNAPVIDESKFLDTIPIPRSGSATLDLSDKATDSDGDTLTWSTQVADSQGNPYDDMLIIEINENNVATMTPVDEDIDNGYILFTVSDGELTDFINRPYALWP